MLSRIIIVQRLVYLGNVIRDGHGITDLGESLRPFLQRKHRVQHLRGFDVPVDDHRQVLRSTEALIHHFGRLPDRTVRPEEAQCVRLHREAGAADRGEQEDPDSHNYDCPAVRYHRPGKPVQPRGKGKLGPPLCTHRATHYPSWNLGQFKHSRDHGEGDRQRSHHPEPDEQPELHHLADRRGTERQKPDQGGYTRQYDGKPDVPHHQADRVPLLLARPDARVVIGEDVDRIRHPDRDQHHRKCRADHRHRCPGPCH